MQLQTIPNGHLKMASYYFLPSVHLGQGNGIMRLNDIISWPEVSIKAGSQRTVLSFQRGYVPFLRYLSSDFVVTSITSHLVNALYTLIMENLEHFSTVIHSCLDDAIYTAKSFKDPNAPLVSGKDPVGSQVIVSLEKVLFECVTRFKNALATHPLLRTLVLDLRKWTDTWIAGVSLTPPAFDDAIATASIQARDHIIQHVNNHINQLLAIVDRKYGELQRSQRPARDVASSSHSRTNNGVLAALENAYEGPGELRTEGPRHDNDFVSITDIRIAPTHAELTCRISPFLPANLYGAPHPFPAESMQRLLDIQFRLLREELTASLRISVQLVLDDLMETRGNTQLAQLIQKRGGKYRGHVTGQDTVLFNVYTNVDFSSVVPDRRGLSVGLTLDAPPGRARSQYPNARVAFWESMASKRLIQGGLVAFICKRAGNSVDVHLGTISSSAHDLSDSARQHTDKVSLRIAFFDSDVVLRILQELRNPEHEREGSKFLVEATVMYESIRPFLNALRVDPEIVPFSRYLVHRPPAFFDKLEISPPEYARLPNFTYQLSSLFSPETGIEDLRLTVSDPVSIEHAREILRRSSRLDPSQADAVVASLTREVVLIQGPPGTGKSYTGVELLRVLLANEAGPVLMIAFTNHALDHMLGSVLDANITNKLVRLGSRSADERISQFSIENMEKVAGKSRLHRSSASYRHALRDVEDEIKKLMKEFMKTRVDSDEIAEYMEIHFPSHFDFLTSPPSWVQTLYSFVTTDSGQGSWRVAGKNRRDEELDESLYAFWKEGRDLEFLEAAESSTPFSPQQPIAQGPDANIFSVLSLIETASDINTASDTSLHSHGGESDDDIDLLDLSPEETWMHAQVERTSHAAELQDDALSDDVPLDHDVARLAAPSSSTGLHPSDFKNLEDFFLTLGCAGIPHIPSSSRGISDLLGGDTDDMWSMSRAERQRLDTHWTDEIRVIRQQTRIMEFERLRDRHSTTLSKYNEEQDETRRHLLHNVDIIGCTTTGAAKLTSLLKGIGPRIMLVEEAGQVLEAHVLGSLVPTVQHLILIGDPLQLRPTLNNYSLSMDNKRGNMLFKFDMSLMERLSTTGLPMSQIDVQRRMRPAIANLVRSTLYPRLQDHDLVKDYPPVRGMAKNVFFLTHNHKENGSEDDSVSKYNIFEVEMIKDLVLYFLRQGLYSAEGDIVVLCAYLGQLARVRDALAQEVAVVLDERDQAELDDRDAEKDVVQGSNVVVEHVKVSRRVRLRTVDNFQGEEAKIVILSLVRNSGGSEDDETVYGHSVVHRANIGFLRSNNRVNVALSRAREGLYILGNASNLSSRSEMWRSVISQLEEDNSVGDAFPVRCHRHQEAVEYISRPGHLPRIAPDGGCLRQCDARLNCGHLCPYKCHSDDPNHHSVACIQRCTRLCSRGHPCPRQCADACGKCHARIESVKLPCGHIAPHVDCYQLDDLSEVACQVLSNRRLPRCEHFATMKCFEDPAQFLCKAVCGGNMTCCGRSCKAHCHRCQTLNLLQGDSATEADDSPVPRIQHVPHPCERTLYCGHLCGKACSQNHECTPFCKETCRQVCQHARCKHYCSTPCAPCQESCTWKCAHHSCPVPCGSICARLPCDKRCDKNLACGHRCPSVCGEDCSIQVCPLCATEEVRSNTIVDLILQRTLSDVNIEQETLDELLITLPNCRHVFTVETLDGHCGMSEYYRREGIDGKWLGLQAPPVGFQKPPTCPTCRSAITSPRYGRVYKRADLDILENNVAFHMSSSLAKVQDKLEAVSREDMEQNLRDEALKNAEGKLEMAVKLTKLRQKRQNEMLRATRSTPMPPQTLDPSNEELHSVPVTEAKGWKTVMSKLISAYRDAVNIANTRSAHLHAWEASFSYLYQKEMDNATLNPERAPRNPQEYAMRMARIRVGQPQPRADKRFLVETFWTTITIRLTLVELGGIWLEALQGRTSYPSEHRRAWGTYISFIIRACAADARTAYGIAGESESHRQNTKTALLIMRIELEQFRFNLLMMRQNGKFSENQAKLANSAECKADDALKYILAVLNEHRHARRTRREVEEEWLSKNFSQPASMIISEWKQIGRSIRLDTFYEPVSLEELTAVVKGLDFGHAGHFYKCPNGHVYVIADCGGANQRSYCPECGEAIGGMNHRLESTNTRAVELEELARAQGASYNPWATAVA
ncbi:hypothetical protein AcV5_006978 [Taiwanofungus camphoratus]|nr:hypothetical protein AcV5_006978 [Antrodia cinnamomea]